MQNKHPFRSLALTGLCLAAVPATANLTIYSDRTSFESNAGDSLLREDFSGFPNHLSLNNRRIQANGFGLRANVPDGLFSGNGLGPFGYAYLVTEGDTGISVDILPNRPMQAFGADFTNHPSGEHVRMFLTFSNGFESYQDYVDLPDNGGFIGLSVTHLWITKIQFRSRTQDARDYAGDVFQMDNVTIASAPTPVPEPGSLVALSIAGLLAARRRNAR